VTERAELLVVGAGAVGLFTALEAAERGLQPLVLEAEEPGAGASTRNAGVLHLLQPPPGRLRRRLAPLGARLYRRWAERLGLEIIEARLLIVATSRLEALLLRPVAAAARLLAPGVRAYTAPRRRVLELEPLASPDNHGAVVVEGYGVVEPRRLVEALAREAAASGALAAGSRVVGIRCSGDAVTVTTSSGEEVRARFLVNAAGAGALELAMMTGVDWIRVELKPGTMELYQGPRPRTILARIPRSSETKGGAVIPWPQGVLFGPDLRESPEEPPPPPGGVAARYRRLLAEEPRGLIERIEGLRTVAKPRDFHVVKPPGCSRIVHLLGIESPGLTAAPALARLALDAVLGG